MALAADDDLIPDWMKVTQQNAASVLEFGTESGADDAPRRGVLARVQGWFVLPPAAWSRVVVLFGMLASIKLVLLIGLRKHLHQIHWRLAGESKSWLGYLAFYAVMALGVYTLFELSRQCQAAGLRAVRCVNLLVLSLALGLVLLTFHEGDKNYLYPILTGVLPWSSLVPYLSMDFFFRPPFLAGWLLAYGAIYYVMARLGRERWALGLTGAFAGCYWTVCLQELVERRNDLWAAALFGLLALITLKQSHRRLSPVWWLLPAGWTLLVCGLFQMEERALANLSPYFLILLSGATAWFVAATCLAKREGVFQPWAKVVPFYFLTFLLLASSNYPMGAAYNNLLCSSATFPHYFVGELAVTGLVAMLAALHCRLRPRGRLWWLDVLGLGLIVVALVDLRMTEVMGVRLGWDVIQFGNDPTMMWRLVKPYLPGLAAAVAVAVLAYAAAVMGVNRVLRRKRPPGGLGALPVRGWSLAGCFALLAVLGSVQVKPDNAEGQSAFRLLCSSPLAKWADRRILGPEEFRRTASELGISPLVYRDAAQSVRARTNWNVLLIFQESAYNKHSSLFGGVEETQPLLAQYKERMEIFPNFFSSFAGSIHARFAAFTGLYPVRDFDEFTLKRVGVKSIFEILHEQGYACSLFYSSYFDYTGFRDLLAHRGLNQMFDADSMPGERKTERVAWGLQEEETLGAIRRQIQSCAASAQPFFLTYVPASPHYPYDNIPAAFRKHKPGMIGDYTGPYMNALLHMDWVIASILEELKATGLLDKTLVVITSDHGEMLGENGDPVGHGWKVTPELANVPLILLEPGRREYRVNPTIGSQVDLLPTLLDCLGIPLPQDELYQGRSLLSTPANAEDQRYIYLNSYGDFAVIHGQCLWRGDPHGVSGGDANRSLTAFRISNHGQHTQFTEATNVLDPLINIRRFDHFQESLLRNYSIYRGFTRHNVPVVSGHASKPPLSGHAGGS